MVSLSHLSASGTLQMVDISAKRACSRMAVASCRVSFPAQIFKRLQDANLMTPKGDLLATSKLAAIMAAKKTFSFIPLCHPIPIDHVDCSMALDDTDYSLKVQVSVKSDSKTGVEMEALAGAAMAALNVFDMCKALSSEIFITQLMVESKLKSPLDCSSK